MTHSRLGLGLLSAALALGISGCCMDRSFYGASSCAAGPVGEPYCGPDYCCDPDDFVCQGPLGYLRHMFTCGSGCGDYYVDEWASDPPACSDPCDHDGNWTGAASCCPFPLLPGLRRLWGYRYEPVACGPPCGSCGADAGCCHTPPTGPPMGPPPGGWMDMEPMESLEEIQPMEPTPAVGRQISTGTPGRLRPAAEQRPLRQARPR